MYAMFIQGRNGLIWMSNHPTIEEAKIAMNDYTNDMADFIMILPVVAFRDLDGK